MVAMTLCILHSYCTALALSPAPRYADDWKGSMVLRASLSITALAFVNRSKLFLA
jgi:hypothetical protein